MKKILFLNILVMLKLVSWSQKVEWVSHFGGKSTDYGDHITTDNAGNIYTIGTIEDSDSIDFKASKGNGKLLSPNIYSFFILKTNPQGKTIWVKQIGNKSTYITTHAIKCDNKANVYIIGYFINTVDFDPGPDSVKATAPNSNAGDAYIVKLDSSGQFSWLKVLSSTSPKGISSINFDDSNYMYMCGTFSGSLDFDLGSGTYYLSSSTGTGFVAKMNSTGDLIWAKKFDGQDLNTGISCSIDSYSNVYTIGYYFDSVDFDPGPAKHMLYNNSSVFTMYLCKLDKNGSFVWVKNFSGAEIIPHEVSVDKNGYSFTTGYFKSSMDFNPGSGQDILQDGGFFLVRLKPNGEFSWAKNIMPYQTDRISTMTTDASGNVYFGSGFTGTFDFDPGPDNTLRTSNGNLDIYTTMFDSSGNFKWVQTAGSNSMDFTRAMTWSAFDNSIYITGQHSNQAFFDSSLNKIPSNGWDDIFIAKINQVYPLSVGSENIYSYSIYPNPSSGILNISVKNNIYSHEYIYVYNTIGAMVYQTVFGPLLEKTIDLTHLSRGIYFIRLSGLTKTIVIE